jgi:hypothetical protein
MLCARIAEEADIEKSTEEFHVILKTACNKTYRKYRTSRKTTTHKSVPWWTEELTVLRKRTNALRRRHQRTRNNDELREISRKARRNMQQPLKEKSSGRRRNIVPRQFQNQPPIDW